VDWVFGIVFSVFVTGSCIYLSRSANKNRSSLVATPRKVRIIRALLAFFVASACGIFAVWTAANNVPMDRATFTSKITILVGMCAFVSLQTYAAMLLISLALRPSR
jgi:hypothetical protein